MRTVTCGPGGPRARARVVALAGGVVLALATAGCVSSPATPANPSAPVGSVSESTAPPITYRTAPPTGLSGAASSPASSGDGADPPDAAATGTDAGTDPTGGVVAAAGTIDDTAGTNPPAGPAEPADAAATGSSTPPPRSTVSSVAAVPPEPAATSFTGLDSSLSATFGTPVTLSYDLVSGHRSVASARTKVSYGDRTVTVRLDRTGHGSTQLSGLPVGDTQVHLRYSGDARHRPAAADVTVSVGRRHTEIRALTVASAAVTVNQDVDVDLGADVPIAFNVYSGGQPVADQQGTVAYAGTERSVELDADGHASLTLADLPVGQHQVIVRYAGDQTRDGAGAPFTITVTDPEAEKPDGTETTDATGEDADSPDSADSSDSADPATEHASSPCPPTARACVDLTNSTTWLQSGGQVTYGPVPMTSGRPGWRTPSGTFQVYWKDKDHRSTLFDGAPMPNSVFFVGGVAFHEGSLSVASHGCIHLSAGASQTYWDGLQNGDTVVVFGYAPY